MKKLLSLLCGVALMILGAMPVAAQNGCSLAVTTTADGGAGSLRAAINCANATPGTQTITIPAGTYVLNRNGQNEDANATGDLDVTDALILNGAGAATTRIVGSSEVNGNRISDRILDVIGNVSLSLTGLTIRDGFLSGGGGGGVRVNSGGNPGGTLSVTNCAFINNIAPGSGGGIDYFGTGPLTLNRVLFTFNVAGDGSGGGLEVAGGGALTATNCTWSRNFSRFGGGGVRVGVSNVASFLNCTIVSNSNSGIINDGGSVTLKNTLLAFNTDQGTPRNFNGTGTSQGNNLSSDASATSFLTAAGDRNNVDPLLLPLNNNGGPTQTHALSGSSPAIDAGNNTGAPPVDQRGVTRPQGARVDIGAFEAEKSDGCSLAVTVTTDSGVGSLRAAIDCANATAGTQTITIPAGTYTITRAGADEDTNRTGDFDITDDVIIRGASSATTIIDGGRRDRVFDVHSPLQAPGPLNLARLTSASLNTLTIRNGLVTGNGAGVRCVGVLILTGATVSGNQANTLVEGTEIRAASGGGVFQQYSGFFNTPVTTMTITNCQFINNGADYGGGVVGANRSEDTLRLIGSTFTGNRATDSGGGGVADGGGLNATNCTFSNNIADSDNLDNVRFDGSGGGFLNQGGDTTLTDCNFDNNKAGNGGGGGFENAGGNLTLLRCRFTNNRCGNEGGGGFENEGGDMTMTDCVVTGNTSTSANPGLNEGGGGFENEGGSLVMLRCTVSNNTLSNVEDPTGTGGGGFENEGGNLDMTDCTIANNTADGPGGGFLNQGGQATLLRCTIAGNTTTVNGGGISFDFGGATLTNCTISGNQSGANGGGIGEMESGTFLNCTFAGNRATTGGAIFQLDRGGFGAPFTFQNTIFTSATGGNYGGDQNAGAVVSNGGNISSDATLAAFFTQPSDKNSTDPRLDVLKNNGGPTPTHALLPGSPAVDGGVGAGAPATDQRGTARPIDGDRNGTAIVDSGAFEAPPVAQLSVSVNDATVTEGNTGTTNAVFTLTLSAVSNAPVSVTFSTRDNEAAAPGDFTAQNRTITIPAGQRTATVIVPIIGDRIEESNELFTVALTNPQGAALGRAEGNGRINNDDTASATIDNVSVMEGNAGTTNAVFTVTLSNPSAFAIAIDFATANGTATAPNDYTTTNGTLTFAPGQVSRTINVPVVGDTQIEADETFTVNIAFPDNGGALIRPRAVIGDASGTATIINDDQVVVQRADLRVTQTVSAPQVAIGQNATFTITVTNAGPAIARSVLLTNTLPTGATFVSATPAPATNRNGVLTFNLGDLAVNASRTFRVTVRLTQTGTFINRAIATSPTSDPAQANNTSGAAISTGAVNVTGQIAVTRGPLVIVGPYLPGLFGTGSRFRQSLTLRNNGAAITGPLSLVLDNLSNAKLLNASGITRNTAPIGSPFINVNIGTDNLLATDESVTVVLEFSTNKPTYTPRILAGAGTR